MTIREFNAWAIDTCSEEGHGFMGRYTGSETALPTQLAGCRLALFDTRAAARKCLKKHVKLPYYFPKAKVVKVLVTVQGVLK